MICKVHLIPTVIALMLFLKPLFFLAKGAFLYEQDNSLKDLVMSFPSNHNFQPHDWKLKIDQIIKAIFFFAKEQYKWRTTLHLSYSSLLQCSLLPLPLALLCKYHLRINSLLIVELDCEHSVFCYKNSEAVNTATANGVFLLGYAINGFYSVPTGVISLGSDPA